MTRSSTQDLTANAGEWYAAHVRSNRERAVASFLAERDMEAYVPVFREQRQWSDRVKLTEMPLFPGYVFCRVDADRRAPLRMTPGVIRIVGAGKTPVPIDETEMTMLRLLAESEVPRLPHSYPALGDTVEIRGGPLAGVTGVLEQHTNGRKLVVSISLLQRSVAVELDQSWIAVQSRSGNQA